MSCKKLNSGTINEWQLMLIRPMAYLSNDTHVTNGTTSQIQEKRVHMLSLV